MSEQAVLCPGHTQATKPCWLCRETSIPYTLGFCEKCWNSLEEISQTVLNLAARHPDPGFSGSINATVVEYYLLKRSRYMRPPSIPRKSRPSLADLDISL